MSSAITCYRRKEDGKFVIINGHHRYAAAVKLGLVTCPCIFADESELSKDEIIALQLSHNSLHGEDDKGILRRLLEEIKSIEFKEFAHIDLDEIGKIDVVSDSVIPLSEHFVISLILYKNDVELLDDLIGKIDEAMAKSEIVLLADQKDNEEFLFEMIAQIGKKYNILSQNVAFSKILNLAKIALENDLDSNNRSGEAESCS